MRLAKYLFFYLLLSFFSYGLMGCGGDSRRGDGRGSFENEEDRNQEWRRLKDSDFISSDLDRRYKGGDPSYEDFGGEKCENIPACKRLCDDLKQNRRECYRAPEELVEQLEDGLFNLINISQVDSVDISPSLMAGILDIHFDGVVDLVKNKMNEGDLKSFLAWLALNEPIAEAFLYQDKRNLIVREAFEALGAMQTESKRKKEETGLNTGLIREDESFFYLASVENNSAGFQIAYKILHTVCNSSRDCKMDLLCAREERNQRRRSRSRYSSASLECKTSADTGRRRLRRDAICYLHGQSVWNYLNELLEEEDIRDGDFRGAEKEITVQACNDFCDKDSDKCKRMEDVD